MDSAVTGDFIFGTLGTDELRLAHEKTRLRGVWHGSRTTPADPQPGDDVTFLVTVGTDVAVDQMHLVVTRDGSHPQQSTERHHFVRQATSWSTIGWGYTEDWSCTVPSSSDELWRYQIQAVTPNGDIVWADTDDTSMQPALFALSIDSATEPAWLGEAVVYQVFVDRFATSDGRAMTPQTSLADIWGGTLRGVTAKLEYIKTLGATAIWLSPVFPSPSHHGYDVTDYRSIEPRLGTMDDFDALLAAAHDLGLRVILDFVASHCSDRHPYFQEALRDPMSEKRALFTIGDDGSYDTFFGVKEMPRINGVSDAACAWMCDSAAFWLERGVDGFRLDYAIGQSLQFWTRFRRQMRAVNPEVALIAEAVDSAETLRSYRGRLDGVLDFLCLEHLRLFIGFERDSASEFWTFLVRHTAWFEDGPTPLTFLDNHDMNRMLWIVQGDTRKLKIAALLQMSLPMPPVIYYGTEVGLNQWHDLEYPDGSRRMEESRTPMLWGSKQDRELLEFYRSLVFWRKRFGMAHLRPRLVHAGDDGTLLFAAGPWLIAINRNPDEITIDVGSGGSMWLTLATGADVQLHGSLLKLPGYAGAVLANERAR